MHPDVHLMLHHARAAELYRRAATAGPRHRLRTELGWALVGLGLRLATPRRPLPALPGSPAAV
ncbi:hypothetical protein [Streptomyces sp. NPDC050560]|uniref:hypothetical protein n=1 Tax=Streptomyces sp. NPDC050560 TaxID=3365630 RepID=UPI0037B94F3D